MLMSLGCKRTQWTLYSFEVLSYSEVLYLMQERQHFLARSFINLQRFNECISASLRKDFSIKELLDGCSNNFAASLDS